MSQLKTKSVFVAVVGRPNVGKSSLVNKLVGEKVAIVTSKPQTTRTKITGILTSDETQYVFLDTPGIHSPKTKLGSRMVKTSVGSIADVDVAIMLFEPYGKLSDSEQLLIENIIAKKVPAIAVINKNDLFKKSEHLAQRLSMLQEFDAFDKICTASALNDENCKDILAMLDSYSTESVHYFDKDTYTDLPEKVLVAEILREKILLNLRDEIPHGTAVTVERFKERPDGNIIDIDVNIYCEKKSHKGMIIGKGGQMLKKIASSARVDCEEFLATKVNLQCWVKIKDDWRDNEFLLNNLGFKL